MTTLVAHETWSQIEQLAGQEFRGDWFRIDPDRLPLFDYVSYVDENVNHLDSDFYPDQLIEGFHLLALLDHLINAVCYIDDPRWAGWNYGFDRVRFVSVTTAADAIRIAGRVASVEPRGTDRYLVSLDCELQVEGRDKPALVAEWKVMWTRAEASHE